MKQAAYIAFAVLIPALVGLYLAGKVPFDKLVEFYDLKDINQAVENSEEGVTLKLVVRIGSAA